MALLETEAGRPFVLREIKQKERQGQVKRAPRQICHLKPAVTFQWVKSSQSLAGTAPWKSGAGQFLGPLYEQTRCGAQEKARRGGERNRREWVVKQLPLCVVARGMAL